MKARAYFVMPFKVTVAPTSVALCVDLDQPVSAKCFEDLSKWLEDGRAGFLQALFDLKLRA
jgi:hypothetical protein